LVLFYQIVAFLKKGPHDVIHCHFGPNGNLAVVLKDLGVIRSKIITAFHGYDLTCHMRSYGDNVYDYLFTKGDLFLPISEYWKNRLIKLGCCKDKIVVHRMGVDTNKFLFSPRKPKNDDKVKLLTIARLVEKKGVEYGIMSVAEVIQKHPNVVYEIIGDGLLRRNLEGLIEDLKIGDRVKLLGWKQQEEVVKLMEEADILLAPSVTSKDGDQEGIPVV